MLTETMTAAEKFAEMRKDWRNILNEDIRFRNNGGWKCARSPKAKYPMQIIHEWTSPTTHNRYLLQDVLNSRREALNGNGSLMVRALLTTAEGVALCMQNIADEKNKYSLLTFRPHLFKRYKERMGLKMDGIDLIRHFLKHNTFFVFNEDYRRSEGNTTDVMITCYDGAVFGRYDESGEVDDIDLRTFISSETMQEGYKAKFNGEYESCITAAEERALLDPYYAHIAAHTIKHRNK
ncbi:MAG: hypothetical protein IJ640_00810 [Prevotella sp.]|nr:hypothetical protein [Prevotella sp.]